MKIKKLFNKVLVGYYDIDKGEDPSPLFVIKKIEYSWGVFTIFGHDGNKQCTRTLDEEDFLELAEKGEVKVTTHKYYIKDVDDFKADIKVWQKLKFA